MKKILKNSLAIISIALMSLPLQAETLTELGKTFAKNLRENEQITAEISKMVKTNSKPQIEAIRQCTANAIENSFIGNDQVSSQEVQPLLGLIITGCAFKKAQKEMTAACIDLSMATKLSKQDAQRSCECIKPVSLSLIDELTAKKNIMSTLTTLSPKIEACGNI